MYDFLRQCRSYFVHAAVFSLFINLLLLTVPLYMLQVYDRVLTSRSQETLLMLTLVAVGALLVHMALDTLRSRLLLAAGVALDGMAGPLVLEGMLKHSSRPGASAYATGLKDLSTLRGFLTGNSIVSLFDAPWLPLYVLVIFLFHWQLGVISMLGAIALFSLGYLNEKLSRRPLAAMNHNIHHAARCIDSGVRNAEVVNVLGMLKELNHRWQRFNAKVIDAHVTASRRSGLLSGLTKFVRLLIQVLMLAAGAKLVIDQQMTAGVMIAATMVLARALAPVENAILTWKGLTDARAAYGRLKELLGKDDVVASPAIQLPAPDGKLQVERALFGAPGTDRVILKGVSFSVNPGESLGIIGPSGCGKSTLARLVTGLWRPNSGVVRLDSADISVWPKHQLGPHIGYLPQDVELFGGTVGENISRLGDGESEAVIQAAKRARAHELVLRLPKGYDTEIGEGGMALSGGQRQRIALARALYGNPRLVVLDEPNAYLDAEGEAALLEAMRELKAAGRTLIVISHRISLLAGVDKLLVLRDGQVQLFGSRAEVMARLTRSLDAPVASYPHLIQGGSPA